MTIEELLGKMGPDRFVPALGARKKDDALVELTEAAVAGSAIKDRDLVLELLRNREQLGSTALHRGVAFPHGRSLAVPELTVLAARSADGVDFGGSHGKPTHLFFLILAPPQDAGNLYLQALGKIASVVQDDATVDQLMAADDWDAFSGILSEAGK